MANTGQLVREQREARDVALVGFGSHRVSMIADTKDAHERYGNHMLTVLPHRYDTTVPGRDVNAPPAPYAAT